MVLSVANKNISIWCDGNSLHSFEFSITTSPSSKWVKVSAIRIKDLNTVVPRIP